MKIIRESLVAVGVALLCAVAHGQSTPDPVTLDIPSQRMQDALNALAKQSGLQVVFAVRSVEGKVAPRIRGSYTPEGALKELLSGTSLSYEFIGERIIAIRAPGEGGEHTSSAGTDFGALRLAQSTAPASDSQGDPGAETQAGAKNADRLEEVTVTATKREVSNQKVPVSVTALSEEGLARIGADSFADFALRVPGLHMKETGSNGATFVIRGIAPLGADTQDTVVPYIDDLPTTDTSANITTPDLRLFDVERVEVLRGPQGTLFGSGAMGGAIRILTNKPALSGYAAKIDVGLQQVEGGDLSKAYNAMVNVPLVEDRLALRLVGYYRDEGGWIDTVGDPNVSGSIVGTVRDSNSETAYGGRAMLRFKPTEQMDILARLIYQRSEPDARPYYTSIDGERAQRRALLDFYFEEATIANLVVGYDFGPVSLKSSTTHYRHDGGREEDFSVFSGFLFPDLRASRFVQSAPSESFFEEIHLSSNGDGPLTWLAGLYFRDQYHRKITNRFYIPGSEELLGTGINGAPGDLAWSLDGDFKTQEKALFGELSYQIAPKLVGTVGVRRFRNSLETHTRQSGGLFYPDGPAFVDLDSNEQSTNYKFSLAYTPVEDVMVYLTAAEGYRVGNANLVPLGAVGDSIPPTYGPDSLWNYELGTKSVLRQGRLMINAAAFYIDWSDMQISASSPDDYGYIDNIGKAHSQGVELEISALLGETFEYTLSAGYVDARIDVDYPNQGASSGDRIPGAPKYVFANILRKTFRFMDRSFYAQFDHQYAGKVQDEFSSACGDTCTTMGNYHLFGLRAGAQLGRWEVYGSVSNLLNDDSIATVYDIAGGTRYYPVVPRTVGLGVRAEF